MNQEKNPETLLFNTCFALNKSHSKFVFLGLQYFAKEFRPVIQFGGGTSPHKYVTMDKQGWEKFTEHFGTIQEYMINDERGPRKITMPSHNITMMTCYSAKVVSHRSRKLNSLTSRRRAAMSTNRSTDIRSMDAVPAVVIKTPSTNHPIRKERSKIYHVL